MDRHRSKVSTNADSRLLSVIVGYFIAQFIDILAVGGKEFLQLVANHRHSSTNAFDRAMPLEMMCQHVDDIVPEVISHLPVNALVTQDGEFAVLVGDIDEHGIAAAREVEPLGIEHGLGLRHGLAQAVRGDMDTYFARGLSLGLGDGLGNEPLTFNGYEIFEWHLDYQTLDVTFSSREVR